MLTLGLLVVAGVIAGMLVAGVDELMTGLIVLGVSFVVSVMWAISSGRQTRAAGGEPEEGEFAYAWEGGVSGRTSAVMLAAWAGMIGGVVLVVIGLT